MRAHESRNAESSGVLRQGNAKSPTVASKRYGANNSLGDAAVKGPDVRKKPEITSLKASTLCEAFQITAAERSGQVALRTADGRVEITFGQYAERVKRIATGLHALGTRHGDTVAMMLTNRPEFNLVDTAAFHLGATPFSVYNTLSAEQIAYLFGNAGNRVVVTEPQYLERILSARTPKLEHIVLVEGGHAEAIALTELEERAEAGFDFEAAWRTVQPEDVLTLIYTSGTTGPPKGVQLTHANIAFECRATAEALPMTPGGRQISFLPSAHVADRWLTHYYPSIYCGATITSLDDARKIGATLAEVRPTVFGAVPRLWEKMKAGLEAAGITDPSMLPEETKAGIRVKLGLDQTEWLISGAAPIAGEVLQYFMNLGLPIQEIWGMSETSCIVTVNPPGDIRIGTVGKALPGVELRTLDDGELLVRAPLVMKGYRHDPEKTAEALDEDGWLRTGDIARIEDGYVRIIDRKKEIIINAAGKNMSPANIEQHIKSASPLIGQAICIGDARPYNVALIVLDPDTCAAWAREHGLPDASPAAMAEAGDLRALIEVAVAKANNALSRVEQIKRFAILGVDWEPGGDELTPTSKLKRKAIHAKYATEIERLYAA
jgi:long-subunit acyl-CoA synthetase (AMP-forming)